MASCEPRSLHNLTRLAPILCVTDGEGTLSRVFTLATAPQPVAQDAVPDGDRPVGRPPVIDSEIQVVGRVRERLDLVVPIGGQQQRVARAHLDGRAARVLDERRGGRLGSAQVGALVTFHEHFRAAWQQVAKQEARFAKVRAGEGHTPASML